MAGARPAALLGTLLLLTAGCQGFAADQRSPETPTTPAPVPTATAEQDPDVAAARLASRHREGIGQRSFRLRVTFGVTYENGTTGTLRDTIAVGTDGGYRRSRWYAGPFPDEEENLTLWRNGSRSAVRRTFDNGSTVVRPVDRPTLSDPTLSRFVGRVVDGFDVTATRADGGRRLTGVGADPSHLPVLPGLTDVDDARLTVLLREGVVRRLVVTYRATYAPSGEAVTVRFELSVADLGETSVPDPDWAPEATPTAATATPS